MPGEADTWELGVGAGFYVDATRQPWKGHYRMYSYILELQRLILAQFPVNAAKVAIMGHSMGGYGALVLALRNRGLFRSVSALAPICAPKPGAVGVSAALAPTWETTMAWHGATTTQAH